MQCVSNLKILSPGPSKSEPRVGDTSTSMSGLDLNIPPFQGGRLLQGLVWVGDWLTFSQYVARQTNDLTLQYSEVHSSNQDLV